MELRVGLSLMYFQEGFEAFTDPHFATTVLYTQANMEAESALYCNTICLIFFSKQQ